MMGGIRQYFRVNHLLTELKARLDSIVLNFVSAGRMDAWKDGVSEADFHSRWDALSEVLSVLDSPA